MDILALIMSQFLIAFAGLSAWMYRKIHILENQIDEIQGDIFKLSGNIAEYHRNSVNQAEIDNIKLEIGLIDKHLNECIRPQPMVEDPAPTPNPTYSPIDPWATYLEDKEAY